MTEPAVSMAISGGTQSGIIGAATVTATQIIINNYPAPVAEPAVVAAIGPCPFPGLAYFGPNDAGRFFGRDEAIGKLVAAVGRQSLTALVGASGSGKSSVVLAGLAPRLHHGDEWLFSYFRIGNEPDREPFLALARALVPFYLTSTDETERLVNINKLAKKLRSGELTLRDVFAACRSQNKGSRILLIADQFEEAFTLVQGDANRTHFIDVLLAGFPSAAGSIPDICLVLTLRADFYGHALRHRPLADALQGRVENLGPMTREELREAITRPAGPVTFESGLVETLLDDVTSRPGSLPLLQFALREMWGYLDKPRMTCANYEAIGGVEGALAKRAQAIYEGLTKKGEDTRAVMLFRQLFTRLVTLGEGAEDTRRIVGREELGPEAWQLAQRLAGEDNRLVVTSAPAPDHETAEVVHEALIRSWPALTEWVNRDRAFQSWLRQLKPRVDEWREHPLDEGTLLRGGPLAVAEEWLGRRRDDISEAERAYIEASIALRDLEKRREDTRLTEISVAQARTARLQRIGRWTLAAVAIAVALGIGFGGWEYKTNLNLQTSLGTLQTSLDARQLQLDRAEASLNTNQLELQHQHANLLGELASVESLRGNFDSALRIAVEGVRADFTLPPGTVTASSAAAQLAAAVSHSDWRLLLPDETVVNSAAFSPDGKRIVTASWAARIWDSDTAKEISVLRGHNTSVTSAAFGSDGARIVTASADKTARIWDAGTAKEIEVLRGHEDRVTSAAFSPDGSRIVTASSDPATLCRLARKSRTRS